MSWSAQLAIIVPCLAAMFVMLKSASLIQRLRRQLDRVGGSLACAIAIIQNDAGSAKHADDPTHEPIRRRWCAELIEEAGWTEEDFYAHLGSDEDEELESEWAPTEAEKR